MRTTAPNKTAIRTLFKINPQHVAPDEPRETEDAIAVPTTSATVMEMMKVRRA
jgi:hypothetical protein